MESEILANSLAFTQFGLNVLEEHQQAQAKHEEARYRPGGKVDLNNFGDQQWLEQFRFTRNEIHQLVDALDLPDFIKCNQANIKEDKVTALCMLLRRLAYPIRLADVEMLMGWERSRFSRITRLTAEAIYGRWKHLLRFDPTRLTREKLAEFGRAVAAKGAPLDNVVAFIDGTLQKNARPSRNQRLVYNGWKRIHCLKYHAVLSPDGIIIHVYGPVDGRRHDETVFKESGLSTLLDAHFWKPNGEALFIYGDHAYNMGPHVMTPYTSAAITRDQKTFNAKMSRVRESVEWIFKEVTQQFTYLDFARSQKLLLTPSGLFYMVSMLLCNAHTILHYPQIPQYFACAPPTLAEYFTGGPIEDTELDRWSKDSMWMKRIVRVNAETVGGLGDAEMEDLGDVEMEDLGDGEMEDLDDMEMEEGSDDMDEEAEVYED